MRIAVVAGPDAGHAFPAAGLAVALRDAGHDSLLLTGARWLPPLARDDIAARALPILAPSRRERGFGYRLYGRAAEAAPGIAAQLREFRADAVIADTITVGGAFAAQLLGLPWAELIPHPLQDLSAGLPPVGTGWAAGRGRLGRARDGAVRALAAKAYAAGGRQRAAARRSAGLTGEERPAVRLVATLPGLEHPRPDWPCEAAVVGPLVWDPADTDPVLPPGDGPLVALSPSTVHGHSAGLLECALAGLAGCGVRLAAFSLTPYAGSLPGWARLGPGRQGPLLDRADAVIGGGGHGTVAKALVAGAPLVIRPGGGDQLDNAKRVARLGAGLMLGQPTPRRLRAAVLALLADPAYRAAAQRVGASGEGLGPAYAARVVTTALAAGSR